MLSAKRSHRSVGQSQKPCCNVIKKKIFSVNTYFLSPASNQEGEWTQLSCGGRGREGNIYKNIAHYVIIIILIIFYKVRLLGQDNLKVLHGQGENKKKEEEEKEADLKKTVLFHNQCLSQNRFT